MSTTYTTNYHLGKQEDTSDNFNMSVITDNMDTIDSALGNKSDKSSTYTKTEVDAALSAKQNTISDLATIRSGAALGATAVQPETGKGLSTNDYTTAEKTKLDNLAEIKTVGTGLNLDDNGELTATGGGSGGTTNYNDLSNKPQINGNTLSGNKTSAQLGLASASDIPTVPITAIQKNGTGITPVSGTVNITVPTQASDINAATATQGDKADTAIQGIKVNNSTVNPDSNKVVSVTVPTTAADVSALPDTTKYAAALSLTINSSTFVMTGQLKDQNGDNLGTAQTIDLPLESVVVGGSYNSQTKKVVLTLQNGNTIEFSVADLVSGLQTELSASNKLNPAYINYDSTHRAVSDTEKSTWNGKQNALSFDGTYSASTNKAATVSTVTNAVNALDVTGDASVSASKTISAWSETDGKVSISTQDIAIAGTQTTLTGYAKSGTAGQAVAATDNVNQAIGKLEATVDDNKNNILLLTENGGGLNILDIQNPVTHVKTSYTPLSNGGVELSCSAPNSAWTNYNIADIPCITGKTYKVYIYIDEVSANPVAFRVYLRQDNSNGTNYIDQRITETGSISYTITAATNKFWVGIYLNNSDIARTVTTKMRMMIVQSDTDVPYQPYAMSNVELTAAIQALQAQLANQ